MLNAGGSHARTTSVPARGAVTMVSDPPIRSARSCMLVRPKPAPKRSWPMPRPSSATESRNPTDRVAVTNGVRQRFLGDADDLAPYARAELGQVVDQELDRHIGRSSS